MKGFPCSCGGPSEYEFEDVSIALADMFERDPTPFPLFPVNRGCIVKTTLHGPVCDNKKCGGICYRLLTTKLLKIIETRNEIFADKTSSEESRTRINLIVRDFFEVFSGKYIQRDQYHTNHMEVLRSLNSIFFGWKMSRKIDKNVYDLHWSSWVASVSLK